MLVSNFELLLNRIAPSDPSNPSPRDAVARRVVQGHFLTISNTELHRSVYFRIKYTYGNYIPNPAGVNRELRIAPFPGSPAGNVVLIYDGGSLNNQLIPTSSTTTATGVNIPGGDFFYVKTNNLKLRAGETGLLALLPYFQGTGTNSLAGTVTDLEVRGFVSIEQVSDAQYINSAGANITETNPFVGEPAHLILNSEHRATFLDDDFNGINVEELTAGIRVGFDFDQVAYTLPLAEGKSLYKVPGA